MISQREFCSCFVALSVASSVICRVLEGKLYRIRKHKMENKTNAEQQFRKNARIQTNLIKKVEMHLNVCY